MSIRKKHILDYLTYKFKYFGIKYILFFFSFQDMGWSVILRLAFQSIGVVYGDVGTSPLYVYSSTFPNGISHNDDILGVLSLIFYTITLITLIKYVLIVLKANDNGEGKISNYEKLLFMLQS